MCIKSTEARLTADASGKCFVFTKSLFQIPGKTKHIVLKLDSFSYAEKSESIHGMNYS